MNSSDISTYKKSLNSDASKKCRLGHFGRWAVDRHGGRKCLECQRIALKKMRDGTLLRNGVNTSVKLKSGERDKCLPSTILDKNELLKKITENLTNVGGCWCYKGRTNGYNNIVIGNVLIGVHRAMYILKVGAIPCKHYIDHICGNKFCCNPEHLEPVTAKENTRRHLGYKNTDPTKCKRGHDYNGLACSSCKKLDDKRYREKNREWINAKRRK